MMKIAGLPSRVIFPRHLRTSSVALLTVVVLLTSCSQQTSGGVPSRSTAITEITTPANASIVDPALEGMIRTSGSVRAFVIVKPVVVHHGPATTLPGVLPGPYMEAKVEALSNGGAGVRLVHDYNTRWLMLVTITSTDALKRLAVSNAVKTIFHDQQNTTSG